MGNMHGRMPTRGPQAKQNDTTENRQRAAIYVDGNSVAYEGTLTTDTICNFFSDVSQGGTYPSRRAHYGYLINDGEGDIQVEWTFDGQNYGGLHTLRPDERISFDQFTVEQVKLHYTGNPADYRMLLM